MIKKKIIISSYDDLNNPHYGGGGAYVVHEIAKRFVGEFDVTVITGRYKASESMKVDGVYYIRIGSEFFGPKIGQIIYSFLLLFVIKTRKFDLWMESFTPPFSTSFLPLMTTKPVIGLVYMLVGKEMKRRYMLPFDLIEKIGLKTYKKIIVPTALVQSAVQQINPKADIYIIPHGIDNKIDIKKSEPNKKSKEILFIGRIDVDQKGIDLLLRAYSKIKDFTNKKLTIAGSGIETEQNKLKTLIKRLNILENVQLIGRVQGKTKDSLFKNAFCVVIPSRFETFSMVALEALSYGIPLITYDIEGLKWIPDNISIKAQPFSVKKLAKSLEIVIKNSRRRHLMREKGITYVKQHSWTNVVSRYKRLIHQIIN